MRNRNTVYAVIALVVFGMLSAWQSRRLAEHRRERLPEASVSYNADMPPALTFAMAGLGGFRGIISEILWFRVSRLQEEGRFLELVQLADWITRLDPHAAEGWAYNAWNLAYNVSVMMNRPEDRLRWVQNGISLLRDDGLRLNPREAKLYRELAWLYQNKVGDVLDNMHLAYKFNLLETMAPLLNPDGTLKDSAANRETLARLRLDADRMLDMERRFGPVDWRMAETHAVYWAEQGVALAEGTELVMSRRAVYQPLMLCLFRGRFTGSLEEKIWAEEPNPALALPTADYMLAALQENKTANQMTITVRFLASAIRLLSQSGQEDVARKLYQRLADILPLHQVPSIDDVMKGWNL